MSRRGGTARDRHDDPTSADPERGLVNDGADVPELVLDDGEGDDGRPQHHAQHGHQRQGAFPPHGRGQTADPEQGHEDQRGREIAELEPGPASLAAPGAEEEHRGGEEPEHRDAGVDRHQRSGLRHPESEPVVPQPGEEEIGGPGQDSGERGKAEGDLHDAAPGAQPVEKGQTEAEKAQAGAGPGRERHLGQSQRDRPGFDHVGHQVHAGPGCRNQQTRARPDPRVEPLVARPQHQDRDHSPHGCSREHGQVIQICEGEVHVPGPASPSWPASGAGSRNDPAPGCR